MRKYILVLMLLLTVPAVSFGGPHLKKVHDKVNDLAHKHKMKKAGKPPHQGLHKKAAE